MLNKNFMSTKRRVPTRVITLGPQNSGPPSYQLRYNDYIPPFLTIAFIESKNIFQIESIRDHTKIKK